MTFVFLKRYDHYVIVNDDADFIVGSVSTTVPIVMAIVGDPVAGGIVTSLAQPGGNITGRNTARCDGWHGAHVDRTQSIPCLPRAVLSLFILLCFGPSQEDEALASGYELVQPIASPRNNAVRRLGAHQHANADGHSRSTTAPAYSGQLSAPCRK